MALDPANRSEARSAVVSNRGGDISEGTFEHFCWDFAQAPEANAI